MAESRHFNTRIHWEPPTHYIQHIRTTCHSLAVCGTQNEGNNRIVRYTWRPSLELSSMQHQMHRFSQPRTRSTTALSASSLNRDSDFWCWICTASDPTLISRSTSLGGEGFLEVRAFLDLRAWESSGPSPPENWKMCFENTSSL